MTLGWQHFMHVFVQSTNFKRLSPRKLCTKNQTSLHSSVIFTVKVAAVLVTVLVQA